MHKNLNKGLWKREAFIGKIQQCSCFNNMTTNAKANHDDDAHPQGESMVRIVHTTQSREVGAEHSAQSSQASSQLYRTSFSRAVSARAESARTFCWLADQATDFLDRSLTLHPLITLNLLDPHILFFVVQLHRSEFERFLASFLPTF